jgi:hypothetical protein
VVASGGALGINRGKFRGKKFQLELILPEITMCYAWKMAEQAVLCEPVSGCRMGIGTITLFWGHNRES